MARMYTRESKSNNSKLTPNQEIINFLLNYSKSLFILETESYRFEINKN